MRNLVYLGRLKNGTAPTFAIEAFIRIAPLVP